MPTPQQKPRRKIDLREWASEPGKVVTRGEVLALLAMEERRRAAASVPWYRRLLRAIREARAHV